MNTNLIYYLTGNLKQSILGLLIPKPDEKQVFGLVQPDFREKLSRGSKCPTHPSELWEPKLDNNWFMCRALRPVREFSKEESQNMLQKNVWKSIERQVVKKIVSNG